MNLFVASLAFMYIIKFIKTLKYKSLKECLLNARSIVNKWRYLCAKLFNSSYPLVIAVTETWLKPVHDSVNVISLDNYCCFRHDCVVKIAVSHC